MDGVRTPVEGLVDAGAKPVFAFYLGNQVDEKLTIGGVNSAHYTLWFGHVLPRQNGHAHTVHYDYRVGVLVVRGFREKLLSFALLASEQTQHAVDVIDTMLFKCDRKCRLLSTVTRLIYSEVKFDRWRLCLDHNPPASIGYGGFSR